MSTAALTWCSSLRSDVGKVRKLNEDSGLERPDDRLWCVADGMGGYKAGEVASGMCVATVKDVMSGQWPLVDAEQRDEVTGFRHATLMLRDALNTAHKAIYDVSNSQAQCEGMGTTAVAVLFFNNSASIAYVGDSRLYRLRGEHLEQITTDHSLVEEMVARGLYSREDALKNVNSNIVTRALGIEPSVEVDMIEDALEVGDVLMLCSDGLTDLVSDDIIRLTMLENVDNLQLAGERLIQFANERGGKDNISVILARIDGSFVHKPGWFDRLRKRLQGEP